MAKEACSSVPVSNDLPDCQARFKAPPGDPGSYRNARGLCDEHEEILRVKKIHKVGWKIQWLSALAMESNFEGSTEAVQAINNE